MSQAIRQFIYAACALAASIPVFAQSIHIESGTYGSNCGARQANLTRHLAAHCNSLDTCRYVIHAKAVQTLRKNCPADLVAQWSCGPGELHTATVRGNRGNGGSLELTCVPSSGAGK